MSGGFLFGLLSREERVSGRTLNRETNRQPNLGAGGTGAPQLRCRCPTPSVLCEVVYATKSVSIEPRLSLRGEGAQRTRGRHTQHTSSQLASEANMRSAAADQFGIQASAGHGVDIPGGHGLPAQPQGLQAGVPCMRQGVLVPLVPRPGPGERRECRWGVWVVCSTLTHASASPPVGRSLLGRRAAGWQPAPSAFRRLQSTKTPCCLLQHGPSAHTLDRAGVAEVQCGACGAVQAPCAQCWRCGNRFGSYVCLECCMLDDDGSKGQFHCSQCGSCRLGGRHNFVHCRACGSCIEAASAVSQLAARAGHWLSLLGTANDLYFIWVGL